MERTRPRRTASDLPGLDIAEQRSWQNYLDAALRLWATLDRQLAEAHQLSLVDIQVLDVLISSSTGSVRMRELADALAPTTSQLTKQIRRLEARGLVQRESSPDCRRGVVARITDDGRAVVKQATETYALGVRTHLFGPLSRSQVAIIEENCRRIGVAVDVPPPPDRLVRSPL